MHCFIAPKPLKLGIHAPQKRVSVAIRTLPSAESELALQRCDIHASLTLLRSGLQVNVCIDLASCQSIGPALDRDRCSLCNQYG